MKTKNENVPSTQVGILLPEITEALLDARNETPHGEFLHGQCELLARLIEPRSKLYKWSVSIADSGDNLEGGFESQKKAYAWIEANAADERDLLIVEPEYLSLSERTDALMRAVTQARAEGASALDLALFIERAHFVDMGSEYE